ncbi:AAA family ATPase [Robinsoniella peoriensis]
MELKIKNFAKIQDANLYIDGITVIAGENNTGKSTVGKILFSLFNSTSDIKNKIEEQRNKEIDSALISVFRNYIMHNQNKNVKSRAYGNFDRSITEKVYKIINKNMRVTKENIYSLILSEVEKFADGSDLEEIRDLTQELTHKIIAIINLPEERVKLEVVSRYFNEVFCHQINSLSDERLTAVLELIIKQKKMKIEFKNDQCTECQMEFNIIQSAYYVEDPFIIDKLSGFIRSNKIEQHLLDALTSDKSLDIMDNIFESVIAKEKIDEIYNILQHVINGEIIENQNNEYYLKSNVLKEPIVLSNLSTGMKSFIILKMLLEKNILKEKDVLILDEPEIHLHPQWQIVYAEMIVLLQKYFDLSIIITTHSPYFLDAVNIFSVKYGIDSKVNYYLSSMENDKVTMLNVGEDIDLIYKKMASPIRILDTLRYELENR